MGIARATKITKSAGGCAAAGWYYGKEIPERTLEAEQKIQAKIAAAEPDNIGQYYRGEDDGPIRGEWWGKGAKELGLEGLVPKPDQITAMLRGVAPGTGEVLGGKMTEGPERVGLRAIDVTFTVDKDASVLWLTAKQSGNVEVAAQIEQAMVDSAKAILSGFEERAAVRATTKGVQRLQQVEGLSVAMVPETTSRFGDPNLHVHCVVMTKVHRTDGKWGALDARETLGSHYDLGAKFSTLFRNDLNARLGVTWERTGHHDEAHLAGMPQGISRMFSKRSEGTGGDKGIRELITEETSAFIEREGRQPNQTDKYWIQERVSLMSRPEKGETPTGDLGVRWAKELKAGGIDPAQVLTDTVNLDADHATLTISDRNKALQAAIDELVDGPSGRSEFSVGAITTCYARQLPDNTGLAADDLRRLIESDIDSVLNDDRVLCRSTAACHPSKRRFVVVKVLEQEFRIADRTEAFVAESGEAGSLRLKPATVEAVDADLLGGAQLEAAAAIGGDQRFAVIVGPAGTGKTFSARAGVASLHDQGRHVIGLAPSGAAAGVLGDETGLKVSTTIDKLLTEYAKPDGPGDKYRVGSNTTLLVDEAGMVRTDHWDKLTELAAQTGARVVAMGDHHQFTAVGRGGLFGQWAKTLPSASVTTLTDVHRFSAGWEKNASLALRLGKTEILDTYRQHGRIIGTSDASGEIAAATEYLNLVAQGQDAAIFSPTNKTARKLNTYIQNQRISLGELDPNGPAGWLRNSQGALIGDRVVTRRNDANNRTASGTAIANGHLWTVADINTETGAMTLTGKAGRVTIDADYVAEHLDLGYARTDMASQGGTFDASIVVYDANQKWVGARSAYVSLTRGRHLNRAYITNVTAETETPEALNGAATKTLGEILSRAKENKPALAYLTNQIRTPADITTPPPADTPAAVQDKTLSPIDAARQELADANDALKQIRAAIERNTKQSRQTSDKVTTTRHALDDAQQALTTHNNQKRPRRKSLQTDWDTKQTNLETILKVRTREHDTAKQRHTRTKATRYDLDQKRSNADLRCANAQGALWGLDPNYRQHLTKTDPSTARWVAKAHERLQREKEPRQQVRQRPPRSL